MKQRVDPHPVQIFQDAPGRQARPGRAAQSALEFNDFIRDAVENQPGTIQDSFYLTNAFTGFEIWRGSAGLETTSFCVFVE